MILRKDVGGKHSLRGHWRPNQCTNVLKKKKMKKSLFSQRVRTSEKQAGRGIPFQSSFLKFCGQETPLVPCIHVLEDRSLLRGSQRAIISLTPTSLYGFGRGHMRNDFILFMGGDGIWISSHVSPFDWSKHDFSIWSKQGSVSSLYMFTRSKKKVILFL